ncbi:MAG: hypothetical protein O3A20_09785, partial [Planctomycetota bacterium]|nr:hypothetical protein [Planctomycetota bacterium]
MREFHLPCIAIKSNRAAYILLAAAATAPVGLADIESDQLWVQGLVGSNFGIMHADIDTETGEVSAWGDYQGLEGDLLSVVVRDHAGNLLHSLAFTGSRTGFAYGSILVDPTTVAAALDQGLEIRFLTDAFLNGEMGGFFGFDG